MTTVPQTVRKVRLDPPDPGETGWPRIAAQRWAPLPATILAEGLSRLYGRRVLVEQVQWSHLDASSHPVSRIQVALDTGETLPVIFKRLHRGLKLYGNEREVPIYRELLAGAQFGAPQLYASLYDNRHRRYWLFLEDVGDWTLDNCDLDEWLAAARLLARMHSAYRGRTRELHALGCLEDHGPLYYRLIARTARHNLKLAGDKPALARLDAIMQGFPDVVSFLTARPRTLVHGDIFTKNLMVQKGACIRPIDWESAGVGLAAWDLVRLMDGWGSDKTRFIETYIEEASRLGEEPLEREQFARELGHCEIINVLWHLRWSVEECRHPGAVAGLLNSMQTFYSCRNDPQQIMAVLGSHSTQSFMAVDPAGTGQTE